MDSDKEVVAIPDNELKALKKKAKKDTKSMSRRKWETPILLQVGHKRRKLRREKRDGARPRSADVCVMVKDDKGWRKMVRALFDLGCSRSILLKKFIYM